MTDVISKPSLPLRFAATSVRWILWLLASAWITVAVVWSGLHFWIVPRIGEFRPWIEQQASATLGVTVRIGSITAQSNGLIPSVALRDVRLVDPAGREALHLSSVIAALSPRSVLSMGFEQLYVERPVLDVRRTVDGRLWVAGFLVPQDQTGSSAAMDWLFSQPELALQHGTVRWTDELQNLAAVQLDDVNVVLRNRNLRHALRVDANPPASWGARLTVMGEFRQPLWSLQDGNWREWSGQLYADASALDLAELQRSLGLGIHLSSGRGALRAWVRVDRAQPVDATLDVALSDVSVRVRPNLDALDFVQMAGRLGAVRLADGVEYFTQGLAFATRDGLNWPGGNVRVQMREATGSAGGAVPSSPAGGTLKADRLDLVALREIANRLALDASVRAQLAALAPGGLVETIEASWQGTGGWPQRFSAKGRVGQLSLRASPQNGAYTPGFRGADIDFDLNQDRGSARVALRNGALDWPGVFASPGLALDQVTASVAWRQDAGRWVVDVAGLQFANADVQGEAQAKWTGAPKAAGVARRSSDQDLINGAGILDLQGSLVRLDSVALPKYLPLTMQVQAREYLQAALLGGTASNVRFRLRGDLDSFPFENPSQGEFRITANLQNMQYAYAPARVLPKESRPWPALSQASAVLELEHDTLTIKGLRANLAGSPGLQVTRGEVTLTNLYSDTVVAVNAEARGPLQEALGFVNNSPIGQWIGSALATTVGSGTADYRFKLNLPLDDLDQATVQGTVALAGNDVQIAPEYPRLQRARGVIAFNEHGFSVASAQARALGGDVRIEGGLGALPQRSAVMPTLRISGVATAEGLRQTTAGEPLERLGQFATGSAAYNLTLGLRSGVPEVRLTSSLQGMGLALPEPLAKEASTALPLILESSVVAGTQPSSGRVQERWQLGLGGLANVGYVRELAGAQSRVLRGAIAIGLAADESAPLPEEGVAANLSMPRLDVDAWMGVLSQLSGGAGKGGTSAELQAYLPTTMAVRANTLVLYGRTLNNVVVGGGREGLLWRANIDAKELNGYVEYRQPSGPSQGRLYARLARMVINPAAAQDVENLLDQQPASIPALDIVVEDFELRGKKLGRIDVQATNIGTGNARDPSREWRLNRFNISTPEATFTANGNWANVNPQSALLPSQSGRERRRTALNFTLDIVDSGSLLARFGMPDVVAKGKGKIDGQIGWQGSPLTLDLPSLAGGFNVSIENGQFLKADPGIAKLLGVLSLQSLPRRLTLDFRDVFSEGFSFDFVRGDVVVAQGTARTNNLQMKGVNAAVLMEGQADTVKETQQIKVVVVPEINAGSASLLASTINPLVGLTTFLAQLVLRRPLIEANTLEFQIDGTWLEPRVTKVERKSAAPPAPPQGSFP
ncbi:YhdP family protein [Rhodoferax sp.]|jgi:uncharacterized protein (TIGR02099 family)|uniref:YhdP family protein n=1 Tax=Rhodoferax sp. TaxID=50421 RepID=UPI003784C047